MKDPTKFRARFKRWKNGERVYDKGTPIEPLKDKLDSLIDAGYKGPYGLYGYTTDDVSRRVSQRSLVSNNKVADRLQAGADALMLGVGFVPGGQIPSSAYFGARGIGNIALGDYVGGVIDAGLALVGPAVHVSRQLHKPTNLRLHFASNPGSLSRYNLSTQPEGEQLTKFWNGDVVPRMKQALKDENVVRSNSFNRWFNNNFVPSRKVMIGDAPLTLHGQGYSDGTNNIVFNSLSKLWTDPDLRYGSLAHELHHSQRANLERNRSMYNNIYNGYTPLEEQALNLAYEFSDEFLRKNTLLPLHEKGAVNTLLRALLSRQNNYAIGSDLDNIIDSSTDSQLTSLLKNGSSYGEDFVLNPNFNPTNVRKALKYVGAGIPIPFGVNLSLNGYQDGKDGYVKTRRDVDTEEPVATITLPTVEIKPSKFDKDMLHNLRLMMPNKALRDSFHEYLMAPYYQRSLLSENHKINNLTKLWMAAGKPKVLMPNEGPWLIKKIAEQVTFPSGTPRAFTHPWHNYILNITDYDDYQAELSHRVLFNSPYGLKYGLTTIGLPNGDLELPRITQEGTIELFSGYERLGHPEYNAHQIIEPAIDEYVAYGDNPYSSHRELFPEILKKHKDMDDDYWKHHYYKDGKDPETTIQKYQNTMRRVAQDNANEWGLDPYSAYIHAMLDPTYDYFGYYQKYPESKAGAKSHWTDEFKTSQHPTFSVESKYSGKIDKQYNPYGLKGGIWSKGPVEYLLPNPFDEYTKMLVGVK